MLLADGGRSISDLAVLRDQPTLFGPVASTDDHAVATRDPVPDVPDVHRFRFVAVMANHIGDDSGGKHHD